MKANVDGLSVDGGRLPGRIGFGNEGPLRCSTGSACLPGTRPAMCEAIPREGAPDSSPRATPFAPGHFYAGVVAAVRVRGNPWAVRPEEREPWPKCSTVASSR